MPLFSVIVPHLNQLDELDACLTSLDKQTVKRPNFEVIVVDNGSTLPPDKVIARHPGTHLLQELDPGPGLARNRGVQAARGDILCFTDADCRVHPNWLKNAYQTLSSSPEGTILGGDVRIWRDNRSTFTALEAYESIFAYRFKLYIEQHGYSGTGNLVTRSTDFEKVGPFGGIHLAEDYDWGTRARAAGLTFRYAPEMIVFHPARRSIHELFVKWDRHIQHQFYSVQNGKGWAARWVALAFAVLFSPVVDSVKVFTSNRIHGGSARVKALVVLIVVRAYRAWRMTALLTSKKTIVWNRVTTDPTQHRQ
jgi:glycosyltransferase involved in cell wall biosynthesis